MPADDWLDEVCWCCYRSDLAPSWRTHRVVIGADGFPIDRPEDVPGCAAFLCNHCEGHVGAGRCVRRRPAPVAA